MKKPVLALLLVVLLLSCKQGKQLPDVSGVAVTLATQRFEKDFFKIDTLQLNASMDRLVQQYPGFAQDFLFNILGTTPDQVPRDVPAFLRSYQSVYANTNTLFGDLQPIGNQVKQGFRYVHYYFPEYKLPEKLISFIGPIDSYGCILTKDAVAVGLQLFLGKDHPIYASEQGQAMYPAFVSRRFDKAYIPVNVLRNIIDDMYPPKNPGRPLVEQMVEAGKKLYLLDQFLPELPDTLKTGYTKAQLEACYKNERNIWSMFMVNELLYKSDPQVTRDYMVDGPMTQLLGEGSPGNIGQFTGWQIVKKWMEKNKHAGLKDLMDKDPARLFEESKYKPS